MYRTKRLGLVLTPAEKTTVVQMAEAEGGLSQSALIRRLSRNAAQERGIWPPDKSQRVIKHIWELHVAECQIVPVCAVIHQQKRRR